MGAFEWWVRGVGIESMIESSGERRSPQIARDFAARSR